MVPAQQKNNTRQVTFYCQVNGKTISAVEVQRRERFLSYYTVRKRYRGWDGGEILDLALEGMGKISTD